MKRALVLGPIGIGLALAVWFGAATSEVDSLPAKKESQRRLFKDPEASGFRPTTRRASPSQGEESDPRSGAIDPEGVEIAFRPLVEALLRVQERVRRGEQASSARTEEEADRRARAQIWSVDREGVQGAVRSAIPEIRECYESWINLNPSLQGKLIVSFKIETSERQLPV